MITLDDLTDKLKEIKEPEKHNTLENIQKRAAGGYLGESIKYFLKNKLI